MKPGDKYEGFHVGDTFIGAREGDEEGTVETIEATRVPEGRPLNPDDQIVAARVTDEGIEVLDVHEGPARVNSKKYREGYARIFGRQEPPTNPQELN